MYVRPAPGMKIRRPDTLTVLPDHGEDVADADWCARRMRDGDVVEGPPPAPETPAPDTPNADAERIATEIAPSDHVKEV